MQLKDSTNNSHNSLVFFVFSSQAEDTPNCKGNPAIVFLVDSLPTLKEHLNIFNRMKNGDIKKRTIPEFVTFVYLCPYHLNNNIDGNEFSIRWFSPTSIIKRCGHGTLAAAAFILNHRYDSKLSTQSLPILNSGLSFTFYSDSKSLKVGVKNEAKEDMLEKNTQKNTVTYSLQLESELLIASHIGQEIKKDINILRESKTQDEDGYFIIELSDEGAIKEFTLTKKIIGIIDKRALIITAKTNNKHYDIVFRYFAPFYGEQEDSATGSAASILMPFWKKHFVTEMSSSHKSFTKKLQSKKTQLRCYQASKNGGFFIINTVDDSNYLNTTSKTHQVIGYITQKTIHYDIG